MKNTAYFAFFFLAGLLVSPSNIMAQALKRMRVEGHVFSASTLRPLSGARVELWSFLAPEASSTSMQQILTDEGGLFRFEFQPQLVDAENNDLAQGYAFAVVCKYRGSEAVYIMPLYSSLDRGVVYHRNAYIQVPSTVTNCDN